MADPYTRRLVRFPPELATALVVKFRRLEPTDFEPSLEAGAFSPNSSDPFYPRDYSRRNSSFNMLEDKSPSAQECGLMTQSVSVRAIMLALGAFTLSSSATAQSGPGLMALTHPGYKTSSGALYNLPLAHPPGELSAFKRDLDVPELSHYYNEIIRSVQGGFAAPATLAEFAVLRPGRPVRVMLLTASHRDRWAVISRRFSLMPWDEFEAVRVSTLSAISKSIDRASKRGSTPAPLPCTDNGGGSVSYSSGPGGVSADLSGCNSPDRRLGDRLISAAVRLTEGSSDGG